MPAGLLIAVDHGARAAIEPLAVDHAFRPVTVDASAVAAPAYWSELIARTDARAFIVGTSDSVAGRAVEAAARRAAARNGLATVAVEDYAGNYVHMGDSVTDLLVVESDAARLLHEQRWGAACPPIMICASARYDGYRARAEDLRAATRQRWMSPASETAVLWAGQPESEDNLETLRRIGPAIKAIGATLLFKAHPREPPEHRRACRELIDRLGITQADVSALSAAASLDRSPRLVVTQFSSLAIEAGFYGIPALHLLYRDVGGARLRQKKGFDIPPHCERGAGFFLRDAGAEHRVLGVAALDEPARRTVIDCFDDFFATRTRAAPRLAERLARRFGLA